MRKWSVIAVVAGVVAMAGMSPALAKWARMGVEVPVGRLLTNAQRYVEAHPKDAKGYYTLGRLHSLAFAFGSDEYKASVVEKDDLPQFPGYETLRVGLRHSRPFEEADFRHLAESVKNYTKATELEPENALYWLGRGWMLQQGAQNVSRVGVDPGAEAPATRPAEMTEERAAKLKRAWEDAALEAYRKVIKLTAADKPRGIGPAADSAPGFEAAQYMVMILEPRKDEAAQKELAEVKAVVADYEKMPRAETPLVFRMTASERLNDLLDAGRTTTFDLAGDDVARTWPWVKADTAILCWDPAGEGTITSGRQLFGSATWWMFFDNGFSALAALDDNADGVLSGNELIGIRAWIDENGDGKSEPGEMRSLGELGIEAIEVRATASSDGGPANPRGLHLRDGRRLPVYDWTPRSLEQPGKL